MRSLVALLLPLMFFIAACSAGAEQAVTLLPTPPPTPPAPPPTVTRDATGDTVPAPATRAPTATGVAAEPTPLPTASEGATRAPSDVEAQLALLHAGRAQPDTSEMPRYDVTASLEPGRVAGTMRLTIRNEATSPLDEVLLRLYPNARPIYEGATARVSGARVGGRTVTPLLAAEGSELWIPLDRPWTPGEWLEVEVDFETTLASGPVQGYGLLQRSEQRSTFGSAFPLPARMSADGWDTTPMPRVGDAVTSRVALWSLRLRVPHGFTLVSSGESIEAADGWHHVLTGPSRDVALVLVPQGSQAIEAEVAGARVRYWPETPLGGRVSAEEAAQLAFQSVAALSALLGPPPYRELDVVEAPVPIGGYEYPGLVLVQSAQRQGGSRGGLDFLVPHEIAHQWFYALVGNDVTREPWLDEGLTTYATLRTIESRYGPAEAERWRSRWADEYATTLRTDPVGIDRSSYEFADWLSYRGPTYYAPALMLADLRTRLGDDVFDRALRSLVDDFAFGELTTSDVRATFDRVAEEEGVALGGFWERWIRSGQTERAP